MSMRIFDRVNVETSKSLSAAEALSVYGFQVNHTAADVTRLRTSAGHTSIDIHGPGSLPTGSHRSVFYGLDIYSSNAELSGRLARAAGWAVNDPIPYWTAGHPIIESRAHHMDTGLTIFAAQTPPALAIETVLDRETGRLHSDVVTSVWFIEEQYVEQEVDFWIAFGLNQFETTTWYDASSQSRLFQLDEPRRIGGALFVDDRAERMLEILFLEGGGLLQPASGSSALHSVSFALSKDSACTPGAHPLPRNSGHIGNFYESPAGVVYELRN